MQGMDLSDDIVETSHDAQKGKALGGSRESKLASSSSSSSKRKQFTINARQKARNDHYGRMLTATKGIWKPFMRLFSSRSRKVRSTHDDDTETSLSDGDEEVESKHLKLEREISEKMHDTSESAAMNDDLGDSDEENQKQRKELERAQGGVVVYCEAGMEFFAYHNLLHPDGKRKRLWSVFITILVIYSILSVPFLVGFDIARETLPLEMSVLEWIVDFLFVCDILVCFNTSFYSLYDDAYVLIRHRVHNHYLRGMFWIDMVSALPYDEVLIAVFAAHPEYRPILQLFKLLKLGRAMKLGKYVQDLENQLGISPAMFDLIKLCIEVAFVGHIFCCVTWAMSKAMTKTSWIDDPGNDYSLDESTLRDETLYSQYVTSLYFYIQHTYYRRLWRHHPK